jgi:TatD DNase family protein
MLIDTHAHLYLKEFDDDRPEVIESARQVGVEKILLPNIDVSTIDPMNKMCEQFPDYCYPMMGLHPGSVNKDYKKELKTIKKELEQGGYIAIGEIGIDLYWDSTFIKEQIAVFETQIDWAKEKRMPIVIHARDSFNEIFEVLDRKNDDRLSGVFHCFTGGMDDVTKILSYKNILIGLGGILTFKNAGLDKIASQIPLNKIILETDSPYLSPVPYRGKRNQSAYVYHVAEKLAALKGKPMNQILKQTGHNAVDLFNLASE